MNPVATTARAARAGFVPTNSPAFADYVLKTLLQHANRVNTQLTLGLPQPITSDHVTAIRVYPKTNVWSGGITVLDRIGFGIQDGNFHGFTDLAYAWDLLDRDFHRQEQLAKTNVLMDTKVAMDIALGAFRKLGLSSNELRLFEAPVCEPYTLLADDLKTLKPLPLFRIGWPAGKGSQFNSLEMEVSALTSNLVYLRMYPLQRAPLPTNYFQMLGVSTNFAEWGTNFGYGTRSVP
jgi:hypothetical protein